MVENKVLILIYCFIVSYTKYHKIPIMTNYGILEMVI